MKRIIIFGVIAAILCSMSMVCSAAEREMIPNGSYDGTGKTPQFSGTGGTLTEDGEGRTGKAWKMQCGTSSAKSAYYWSLVNTCSENLTLNNTYIFRFYAKASKTGTVVLQSNNFSFKIIDEEGKIGNQTNQKKFTLGTNYALFEVKFLVSEVKYDNNNNQKNCQLFFNLGGTAADLIVSTDTENAYVWVDDVSLVEETADPTVAITATNGDSADVTGSYVCGSANGTVQPITSISAEVKDGHTGAVLIMAYYDANGILKNADSAVVGSDTDKASFSGITTEAGGKFKFYIFENGTIKPLSDKTEVTVVSQ